MEAATRLPWNGNDRAEAQPFNVRTRFRFVGVFILLFSAFSAFSRGFLSIPYNLRETRRKIKIVDLSCYGHAMTQGIK